MGKKIEDKTIYMELNEREIKFRGIATETVEDICKKDEWVYGNLVWNYGHPYIIGDVAEAGEEYFNPEFWVPVEKESVGQKTGLLDKNGKEIYEDDVVMIQEQEDGSAQIGIVKWDTAEVRFFVHVKTNKTDMWYGFENLCIEEDGMFTDKYDIRVIGNIYENPELSKLTTK